MGAVRAGKADVFDERDFFQHVLGLVALVQAAIDDGEREACRHAGTGAWPAWGTGG